MLTQPRVVAADASKMFLFLDDATGRSVREAIAFALYLPGQELTLAAELYSPDVGELQMTPNISKRSDLMMCWSWTEFIRRVS